MEKNDFIIENGVLISYKGSDKKVEIPANIDRIGAGAFAGNCQIESIQFNGTNLKSIDENAFKGCNSLKGIKLPEGLVQIGDYAFKECSQMEYIYIPSHVVMIGNHIVDSKMLIFGSTGSEAEKYAKEKFLAFRTDINRNLRALEQANTIKNNVETRTFDLFGEKITVSNTLAKYHSIMEYYATRKEPIFDALFDYIKHMGSNSNYPSPNQPLDKLKSDCVKRLEKDGIFISDSKFNSNILEPMQAILAVLQIAVKAYKELSKGVSEDLEAKANSLYIEAESKVTGLSYGYVGDSFGLIMYSIDDYLAKKKQRKKAYAQADYELKSFKQQHISQAYQMYYDFCDKIIPHLNTAVDSFVDAICKTEIDCYQSNNMIDADVMDALDVEKSAELVKGLYSKRSPNAEFVIALALKKYPMNMAAHIYALEKELDCKGLKELQSFLALESKLEPHVKRVKAEKFEAFTKRVLNASSTNSGVRVIRQNSDLSSNEIKELLIRLSSITTSNVIDIIETNNAGYTLEDYSKRKVESIISKETWDYFLQHNVNPISISQTVIPIEKGRDYEELICFITEKLQKRLSEKNSILKNAIKEYEDAKTFEAINDAINVLVSLKNYENSQSILAEAKAKRKQMAKELVDSYKADVDNANTVEVLDQLIQKVRSIQEYTVTYEILAKIEKKKKTIIEQNKKQKLIKIISITSAVFVLILSIVIFVSDATYREYKKMVQNNSISYKDMSDELQSDLKYDSNFKRRATKLITKQLEKYQNEDDIQNSIKLIHDSLPLQAKESYMDWLILKSMEKGEPTDDNTYEFKVNYGDRTEVLEVSWYEYANIRTFTINTVSISTASIGKAIVGNNNVYSEQLKDFIEKQEAEKAQGESDAKKAVYKQATDALAKGEKFRAAMLWGSIADYEDSREKSFELWNELSIREKVSTLAWTTVSLKADGTVLSTKPTDDYDYGQWKVEGWTDMVSVSAGETHTVGLKKDGTVVAIGKNEYKQCNVDEWKDIVAISAGYYITVGLKADGTVFAAGWNEYGQCKVDEWKDIIAISAGDRHVVGLKADGTVVAVGSNEDGRCNVRDWKDIIAVSAGLKHTVGIKSDGTVVVVGNNDNHQCDVSGWTDIVAISAGAYSTVGLKSNGTAVSVGEHEYNSCDVSEWQNIVAISAGTFCVAGIKSDGTIVVTEAASDYNNNQGETGSWGVITFPID